MRGGERPDRLGSSSDGACRGEDALNLKQLETLYWIARLGSFHAASRHLKMTQPAVSARVRELERELGVELFDRSERNAKPTPKGRELLAYAEKMVALAAEAQRLVSNREAVTGRVRLGVTSIPARTWVPKLLRTMAAAYPGIEVELLVDASEPMRDLLLAGELDVAFLAGPVGAERMKTDIIGHVDMAFLASPALALPLAPVAPRDFENLTVISGPRGGHLHALVNAWFERGGARLRRMHACSSLTTRLHLAADGLGIAVAAPASALREIAEGRLRVIATDAPLATLQYVVAFPMVTLSPAVEIVARMAKDLIAEQHDLQTYYAAARSGAPVGLA